MSKHTPGPWKIRELRKEEPAEYRDFAIDTVSKYESITIATTFHAQSITLAEDRANAQLIAAAPKLLKACEKLVTRMLQLGYTTGNTIVWDADNAIREAKGITKCKD